MSLSSPLHVASTWVPRGTPPETAEAAFRRAVEAATDFAWLGRGDRVLVKLAMNSGKPYPRTSDPWALGCLVRLLRDRGAGEVRVGDQGGAEHVLHRPDRQRGASRTLGARAGLLGVIEALGATPVFFEEAGYDAYEPAAPPAGVPWPLPPMVTRAVAEVDHVVYLPRISAHALADATLALKLGVGFLREDSRRVLHQAGEAFHPLYGTVHLLAPVRDRLRLVVTSGTRVQATIGPDLGRVVTPDPGLVLASEDPLAHDLLGLAFLRWCQAGLGAVSAGAHRLVGGLRSTIHRSWMRGVWGREGAGTPDLPGFLGGPPWDHPAISAVLALRGGPRPALEWERTDPGGEGPAGPIEALLEA